MLLERETGFEPATSTLARWSSTTELFPHHCLLREKGLEPLCHLEAPDPKSGVSTNFTTLAQSYRSQKE